MTVFSDLQSRALTALRRATPRHEWDRLADVIVQDRRKVEAHLKAETPPDSFAGLLPSLREHSHTRLPLSVANLPEIRAYFDMLPVHKGPHLFSFDGRPRPKDEVLGDFPMAGYTTDQVLRAPGLIDLLNDPRLLDLIEGYLGCVPTLYSLNAWWNKPANRPEMTNVQYFHRDTDDWRFVTLFIYLTDVDSDGGPHQVVPGSHSIEGMKRLVRGASWWPKFDVERSFVDDMGEEFSAKCDKLFGSAAVELTGPAGAMFLVNTLALHRGVVPRRSGRFMIWARYGLGPNTNSADLERGPLGWRLMDTQIPDTPRNRYVNRLLFEFDRRPEN